MQKHEAIQAAVAEAFDRQVDFLQRLVRTRSANPFTPDTSSPDVPVEQAMAAVVHQELLHFGLPAQLHGVSPQRPNVLCALAGQGRSRKTLILTTHMDTVQPSAGYTRDPWEAHVEGGHLYGLGAADAKAQIAIFIYAVHALRQAGIELAGNLTLAFAVDEEPGACSPFGTRYLLDQGLLHGDAAIVGEPGDDKIAVAHRGLYRFLLRTRGEATHVGLKAWEEKRQGRNAILVMARIALALSECTLPLVQSAAFPNRKSVLTFPTLIQGGSGINTVPELCEAYGDVRLLPGLSVEEVKRLIEDQLQELSITAYYLDDIVSIPAVETDQHAEVVQALGATWARPYACEKAGRSRSGLDCLSRKGQSGTCCAIGLLLGGKS